MSRFDKGITYYTSAMIPVAFPEDAVCCRYCPAMRSIDSGSRHMCMATGRILYNIDQRGFDCPAIVEEGKHGSA